ARSKQLQVQSHPLVRISTTVISRKCFRPVGTAVSNLVSSDSSCPTERGLRHDLLQQPQVVQTVRGLYHAKLRIARDREKVVHTREQGRRGREVYIIVMLCLT